MPQTGCSDCDSTVWTITTSTKIRGSLPENTIAIIIDVRKRVGAFRIFENESGKFLAGVRTEEAGKMVIIPWNNGWNYDTIGTLRLGYMLKRGIT